MNKTRRSTITGSTQHWTVCRSWPTQQKKKKKKRKEGKRIEKEVTKLSQFSEDMIGYVEKFPKPYKWQLLLLKINIGKQKINI